MTVLLCCGWTCHTSPSKTLLTRPAREPQVVGFTTTGTYQEAREREKWKAMLADLISADWS